MFQRIQKDKQRIEKLKKYVKLESIAYISGINKNTIRGAFNSGSYISDQKLKCIQRALDTLEQIFK